MRHVGGTDLGSAAPRLGLAVLSCWIAASVSILLARRPDSIASVWFANGVAVGFLAQSPRRLWWPLLLASAAGLTFANLSWGDSPAVSLLLGAVNAAEIGCAALLLTPLIEQEEPPMSAVALRVAATSLLTPLIGATGGAAVMAGLAELSFSGVWRTWYVADVAGMLASTPLVLTMRPMLRRPFWTWEVSGRLLGLGAFLCAFSYFALSHLPYPFVAIQVPLMLSAVTLAPPELALLGVLNWFVLSLTDRHSLQGVPHPMGWQGQAHEYLSMALTVGPAVVVAVLRDRARQDNLRWRFALEGVRQGVWEVRPRESEVFISDSASRMLGYSPNDLGSDAERWLAIIHPDDREVIESPLQGTADPKAEVHIRVRAASGEWRWFLSRGMVAERWPDGSPRRTVGTITDVTEHVHATELLRLEKEKLRLSLQAREEAEQALAYRASHDALTELPNRFEFDRLLGEALGEVDRASTSFVLCFLDLDRFKVVNDTVGHIAGDALLREIASEIKGVLPPEAQLSRLGGDEFGILLRDCTTPQARMVMEEVIERVCAHRFPFEGHVFDVGVSVGLVSFEDGSLSVSELMARADVACYSAKSAGRSRVAIYGEQGSGSRARHHEIQQVTTIRRALDQGEFTLVAQPIRPLTTSSAPYRHFEVLLRMNSQRGQELTPASFIAAAERHGQMTEIDRWVISDILVRRAPLFALSPDVCLSINLSATSVGDHLFRPFLLSLIRSSGIEPRRLCFELTETAAVAHLSAAVELLSSLRALGCRVVLDDFGSGVSSFHYLKSLPIDCLKIDGSFVRGMLTSQVDRAIVEAVRDIARTMGVPVVAECVETAEILEALKEIGVDYVQGYAVGEPQPLDGILAGPPQPSTITRGSPSGTISVASSNASYVEEVMVSTAT